MPKRIFNTVPEELLEDADRVADHFEAGGYKVAVEKTELGFPFTPALLCKRQSTSILVDILPTLRMDKVRVWIAYARSSSSDTRIVVAVPQTAVPTQREIDELRAHGVGCWVIGVTIQERTTALDLGLNVQLPDLTAQSASVREALGPAYDQFDDSYWREGFETACQAFEAAARAYLKTWVKSGRIVILTKKGLPKNPTLAQIEKMTMGQLADRFKRIQSPNYADEVIGKTLKSINKDRVGVVHYRAKKVTETRLRRNVGRHMWSLVEGMKHLTR